MSVSLPSDYMENVFSDASPNALPLRPRPQVELCRRGEIRAEKFLDAATDVFAEKGYQHARLSEIVARAGILRTRMTCTRPTGTMTVVASGSYTPNSFAMTSTMTGTGRMPITMTSRGSGRRTGPCRS